MIPTYVPLSTLSVPQLESLHEAFKTASDVLYAFGWQRRLDGEEPASVIVADEAERLAQLYTQVEEALDARGAVPNPEHERDRLMILATEAMRMRRYDRARRLLMKLVEVHAASGDIHEPDAA